MSESKEIQEIKETGVTQLTVNLFPNSGVHHYFVPIVLAKGSKKATVDNATNFQKAYGLKVHNQVTVTVTPENADVGEGGKKNDLAEWLEAYLQKVPQAWAVADGQHMEWLRYKLGECNYPESKEHQCPPCTVYGIWLAIETATGTRRRGTEYYTKDDPNKQELKEDLGKISAGEPLSTPYVAIEADDLYRWTDDDMLIDLLKHCQSIKKILGENHGIDLQLVIKWKKTAGVPVEVNLIIDLGNTRTTVVGFEAALNNIVTPDNLNHVCRPIYFFNELQDAKSRYDTVGYKEKMGKSLASSQYPDSWFVLQQPEFEATPEATSNADKLYPVFDLPKDENKTTSRRRFTFKKFPFKQRDIDKLEYVRYLKPQMFVKLSPALIGTKARDFFRILDINTMGLASWSSPKRYVWQTEPSGIDGETAWRMATPGDKDTHFLSGDILRYMWCGGEKTQFDRYYQEFVKKGVPEHEKTLKGARPAFEHPDLACRPVASPSFPDYSKSDSLIWLMLSILETAWQQINSEGWRAQNNPNIKRELSEIVVSYPPGWTGEEKKMYCQTWQMACEIFYWSRYPYGKANHGEIDNMQGPTLQFGPDEAIAAQLPIVFSVIKQLHNSSGAWCSLYGKERRNTTQTVRVLSLDIGGGTTDTAVVEYINNSEDWRGVALSHQLLFSDSSSIAGDNLLFNIINNFILPEIAKPYLNDKKKSDIFKKVLSSSANNITDRTRNVFLMRTVFTPLVIQWFEDLANERKGDPDNGEPWSIRTIMGNMSYVTPVEQNVIHFNALFREAGLGDVLDIQKPFEIDYGELKSSITEWIKKIATSTARIVACLDCDLVIISGKTSELSEVKKELADKLPVSHQNLIFAHNHYVGSWFPGSELGRIPDAKLVTVTGTALYHGIKNKFIKGWRLSTVDTDGDSIMQNYWGKLSLGTEDIITDEDSLFCPGEDEWQIILDIGDMIGRAKFLYTALEPVYKLEWAKNSTYNEQDYMSITVTLERECSKTVKPPSEYLELKSVTGISRKNGEQTDIPIENVTLKLQTLKDEVYWLDSGKFDVGALNKLQEKKSNG